MGAASPRLCVIRSQRDALPVGESPDIEKSSPCLGPWDESLIYHYDDSPDGAWRTPMSSSPRVP